MSREVDERIVRLEFENKGFEKKAKQSSSTLEKLKAKMDFRREAKSMDDAFDGKRFDVFVKGLDKVRASFSAFEAVAFSTINNVTNRMVDAGIKMAKSLSVDNISGGWASYNSINETRAALKAQGFEAEQVGKALDKLKWFSDETSYSMDKLTSSMNSFIATGRTMEESTNIVMGIAGAAAMASQKPEKAFNALLQLSQEAGRYITGNTWMSMRNAGLDTEQFKKNVLVAAKEAGTLVQLLDGSYVSATNGKAVGLGNFQQALSDTGFFTGEVLAKLGEMYSKGTNEIFNLVEETGQMTYEVMKSLGDRMDKEFGLIVFGMLQKTRSFEQAIEATRVAVQGSWTKMFELIFGDEEEATSLWSDVAERLIEIFTGPFEKWINLITDWNKSGGRDDLFGDGGALWNLIDAFEKLKQVIKDAFNEVFDIKLDLKGFTEWLKEFTSNLILSDEAAENLKIILKGVFSIVKIVGQVFQIVWELIKIVWPYIQKVLNWISEFLVNVAKGISSVAEGDAKTPMEKFLNGIKNFFIGLWETLKNIAPVLGQMISWVGDIFMKLGETLKKIFSGEQSLFDVKDLLTLTIWAGIIAFLWWMASSYISWSQTMKEFVQSITSLFDAWSTKMYANSLKTFVTSILMIVAAIAILGSMDQGVLTRGLLVVGLIWGALMITMKELKNSNWTNAKTARNMAASVALLAVAILPLIGVIAILGSMPVDMLLKGGIAAGIIIGIMGLLSSKLGEKAGIGNNAKGISNVAKATALFGAALLPMAAGIAALGFIPADALKRGLATAGLVLGIMALLTSKLASNAIGVNIAPVLKIIGIIALFGVALIPLAAGILVLAGALTGIVGLAALIAKFDFGTIMKGLGILILAALAISVAAILISPAMTVLLAFSVALITLSIGILAFSGAAAVLGLALGLMALGMVEFAGAAVLFSGAALLVVGPLLLLSLAISLASVIMLPAIVILSVFAAVALVFAAAALVFSVALTVLGYSFILFSVGMAAFSAAVGGFVVAITSLSDINFGKFVKGLLMFLAVMGILVMLAPAIILLSLAFAALGLVLAPIVKIIELASKAFKNSAEEIKQNIDKIFEVVEYIAAKGAQLLLNAVYGILDFIANNYGPIFTKVWTVIFGFIDVMTQHMPELINKLLVFIITVIDGVAEAIHNNTGDIVSAVRGLIGTIIDLILGLLGVNSDFYNDLKESGGFLGEALGNGILAGLAPAVAMVKYLVEFFKAFSGAFKDQVIDRPTSIEGALLKGASPIRSNINPMTDADLKHSMELADIGMEHGFNSDLYKMSDAIYNMSKDSFIGPPLPALANVYIETYNSEETAEEVGKVLNKMGIRSNVTYGEFEEFR